MSETTIVLVVAVIWLIVAVGVLILLAWAIMEALGLCEEKRHRKEKDRERHSQTIET